VTMVSGDESHKGRLVSDVSDQAELDDTVLDAEAPSDSIDIATQRASPAQLLDHGAEPPPATPEDRPSIDGSTMTKLNERRRSAAGEAGVRIVQMNEPTAHSFCTNLVVTSKYTLLNFIPMNLWEQFRRFANFYFLMIGIFQCIPAISPLGITRPTIMLPLCLVLATSAVKEAVEDYKRRKQDDEVNNKKIEVLRNGEWTTILWQHLQVGEAVRINRDESIPADLVMLASDSPDGIAYVETKNMDGETNLKLKQAIPETSTRFQDFDSAMKSRVSVRCESPRPDLYSFSGALEDDGGQGDYALSVEQILLRGCVLKNTKWVVGVVCYTGADTKLVLNLVDAPTKQSNIEKMTNKKIVLAFTVDFCVCIALAIGNAIWTSKNAGVAWYLDIAPDNVALDAFLTMFTNMINFNGMIPISLYVSMEMVKLAQVFFMNNDRRMYYAAADAPCQARTSNLNEELGQVQYIFSDKTGTLTRNIMEFRCCSIAGNRYDVDPSPDAGPQPGKDQLLAAFKGGGELGQVVESYCLALALCHGVIIERDEDHPGKIEYQAASPDEKSLVAAAAFLEFVFLDRTPNSLTISVLGQQRTYKILNSIEFTSTRKRMTVILRTPEGRIILYCKGADNVILERCRTEAQPYREVTSKHLEEYALIGLRTLCIAQRELTEEEWSSWNEGHHAASCAINDRDEKVAASAELIEQELFLLGGTAIEDRLQDNVPETISLLAQADVKLWVLTGDKQETAINIGYSARLLDRSMEVLILSGSSAEECTSALEELKQRVATLAAASKFAAPTIISDADSDSVATSSVASTPKNAKGAGKLQAAPGDVELGMVNPTTPTEGDDEDEGDGPQCTSRGRDHCSDDDCEAHELVLPAQYRPEQLLNLALVVDGPTLTHIFKNKDIALPFLDLAKQCKSVICCRVSPKQKADVVLLVRNNLDVITLAIGDGANDVSMIQAAHLGIGISGQEGLQATLASDYAIAQFRYLKRLLLVHGRWAYRRVSELIVYSFYKNFTFVLCQFWYALFCGFSGQLFYDDFLDGSYNVFFTGLPIIIYAALDQDVPAHVCLRSPWLYVAGQNQKRFNDKVFVRWLANGMWHSFILFFGSYLTFRFMTGTADTPEGHTFIGVWDLGCVCYTAVVFTVTARLAIEVSFWTWIHAVIFGGSVAMWFILGSIRSSVPFPDTFYSGVLPGLLGRPAYWLLMFVVPVVCVMLRDFSWKYVKRRYYSELNHIALQQEHQDHKVMRKKRKAAKRKIKLKTKLIPAQ